MIFISLKEVAPFKRNKGPISAMANAPGYFTCILFYKIVFLHSLYTVHTLFKHTQMVKRVSRWLGTHRIRNTNIFGSKQIRHHKFGTHRIRHLLLKTILSTYLHTCCHLDLVSKFICIVNRTELSRKCHCRNREREGCKKLIELVNLKSVLMPP